MAWRLQSHSFASMLPPDVEHDRHEDESPRDFPSCNEPSEVAAGLPSSRATESIVHRVACPETAAMMVHS